MNFTPRSDSFLGQDLFLTSGTFALGVLIAAFFTLIAYISFEPRVDKRSPKFVSDTFPIVGALNYFFKPWQWWQAAVRNSKTGHFSFWLGRKHVIGVSGDTARKMFLEEPDDVFDFGEPLALRTFGPYLRPPVPEIFRPGFHNGRSYFIRRLIELQKTERLVKYLPRLTESCRDIFATIQPENPAGFINPHEPCWHTIFSQTCRLVYMDEIADDQKQLGTYRDIVETFMTSSSISNAVWVWMPTFAAIRRGTAHLRLVKLVKDRLDERRAKNGHRKDDGLQYLADTGDSKDFIVAFLVAALFTPVANARMLSGLLLDVMATRPDWQDKVYAEIKTVAATHTTNKDPNATLVEKLNSLPLKAWESSFPTIQLCYTEVIRIFASFPMGRRNVSKHPVTIPDTNEVVPPGSYVLMNSTEVHFNPDIYPNPEKYDPSRWTEDRARWKDHTHGFLGWGAGSHFCPGMRWAKLQQNILLAYAVAMYEWRSCDEKGQVDPKLEYEKNMDDVKPLAKPKSYARFVPRK